MVTGSSGILSRGVLNAPHIFTSFFMQLILFHTPVKWQGPALIQLSIST